MRPENLKTRIFLDSGDPKETKEILDLLGFLDGQTTNPSLIAKNPELKEKLGSGEQLSSQDINNFYKDVVGEISEMIPQGSVSIEVYADANTPAEDMLVQAREMNTWINNAHIKLPITAAGLEAANVLTGEGMRVNMTLCFSQEQGAAVYAATLGAKKGDVFLSPFIGRLDDRGENGMSFIENAHNMFKKSDGHVELLAASVRTYEHFKQCLSLEVDLATVPGKVLKEWAENNFELPKSDYVYDAGSMENLPFEDTNLEKEWNGYNIQHDLTDSGLEKFASDWNGLITK
ncbi:transaldolase [Candidatus Parcubacteria bacterium]|jgi:transaldolase|nr:transaldolase [Candidatus Parcubacteria bacterium]MBT3948824.1 transaldolase [Candidatus Parcubacteria bacterium]